MSDAEIHRKHKISDEDLAGMLKEIIPEGVEDSGDVIIGLELVERAVSDKTPEEFSQWSGLGLPLCKLLYQILESVKESHGVIPGYWEDVRSDDRRMAHPARHPRVLGRCHGGGGKGCANMRLSFHHQ